MCHASAEEGITTIVATPHVLRGRWAAFSIPELEARLLELRKRVGDTPRLLLGSEYFFAHDVVEVLNARKAIVPLAGSRYVLVELAANSVPPLIEQPLYRMQLEGWVPVLAHPERNLVFQAKPDVLAGLLAHGVKTQITAGSLTGEFGPQARAAAEAFLRRNLVHFIATDAHNMTRRAPRMRRGKTVLEGLVGSDVADALMVRNPLAVVENRPLDFDPDPVPNGEGGFFTRLRSFFIR